MNNSLLGSYAITGSYIPTSSLEGFDESITTGLSGQSSALSPSELDRILKLYYDKSAESVIGNILQTSRQQKIEANNSYIQTTKLPNAFTIRPSDRHEREKSEVEFFEYLKWFRLNVFSLEKDREKIEQANEIYKSRGGVVPKEFEV